MLIEDDIFNIPSFGMQIYYDGVDVGGSYSSTGGAIAYAAGSARFGKEGIDSNFYIGTVDETAIFALAMNSTLVNDIKDNGLIGQPGNRFFMDGSKVDGSKF